MLLWKKCPTFAGAVPPQAIDSPMNALAKAMPINLQRVEVFWAGVIAVADCAVRRRRVKSERKIRRAKIEMGLFHYFLIGARPTRRTLDQQK